MASPKPFCPVCGFATLKYQSGNVVKFEDKDLENARCAFYKCDYCGTRVRLDTPKGKLSVIKTGRKNSEDVIRKLFTSLGILSEFPSIQEALRKKERDPK